jgi:hypothetical protein
MAILRPQAIQFAFLGLLSSSEINAFAPKAFALTRLVDAKTFTLSSPAVQQLHALPFDSVLDETTALSVASLGDALQSASVLLGGLLVLLMGLFGYSQSFIIPNAPAQLETQAITEHPDLWSETQTQLLNNDDVDEGGETEYPDLWSETQTQLLNNDDVDEGGETLVKRQDLILSSLRNQIHLD